ncbi:fluoride efflux transporter CrcB [Lacibacter sp. H407]|uniref:fluoride efflux transporter CrcB n=1 Tax=Lacibacter sp. H407 TaxID=3133423 RepID=UPI0030BB4CC3
MLKNFLLVGLGGAAGSMLRYAFSVWLKHASFPLATFLVNIIGSFVIGLVFAYALRSESFAINWRLFLAAGICGGFTTFSAFSLESLSLLQQQRIGMFFLYVIGSLLLGLAATWLGYSLLK